MSLIKELSFIECNLYTAVCGRDIYNVHYGEVVHYRECPLMEIPLYAHF